MSWRKKWKMWPPMALVWSLLFILRLWLPCQDLLSGQSCSSSCLSLLDWTARLVDLRPWSQDSVMNILTFERIGKSLWEFYSSSYGYVLCPRLHTWVFLLHADWVVRPQWSCLWFYCVFLFVSPLIQGGNYVVLFLDSYGTSTSLLFIVFIEAVAVCWLYGKKNTSQIPHHLSHNFQWCNQSLCYSEYVVIDSRSLHDVSKAKLHRRQETFWSSDPCHVLSLMLSALTVTANAVTARNWLRQLLLSF